MGTSRLVDARDVNHSHDERTHCAHAIGLRASGAHRLNVGQRTAIERDRDIAAHDGHDARALCKPDDIGNQPAATVMGDGRLGRGSGVR